MKAQLPADFLSIYLWIIVIVVAIMLLPYIGFLILKYIGVPILSYLLSGLGLYTVLLSFFIVAIILYALGSVRGRKAKVWRGGNLHIAFGPGAGLRALGGFFIFLFSGVLAYLVFSHLGLLYYAVVVVAIFIAELLIQLLFSVVRLRFSRSYFSIFSGFGLVLFYEIIKLLGLLNYLIITFIVGILFATLFAIVFNKFRKGGMRIFFGGTGGFGNAPPPKHPDMGPHYKA